MDIGPFSILIAYNYASCFFCKIKFEIYFGFLHVNIPLQYKRSHSRMLKVLNKRNERMVGRSNQKSSRVCLYCNYINGSFSEWSSWSPNETLYYPIKFQPAKFSLSKLVEDGLMFYCLKLRRMGSHQVRKNVQCWEGWE